MIVLDKHVPPTEFQAMNLTYRGISFRSLIAGAPAAPTEQTGVFLGKPYQIKQNTLALRHATNELTYRGVSYCR